MSFDLNLNCKCNHMVDGLQYWSFDMMTANQSFMIESNIDFRNRFMKEMSLRICPRCNGQGWYYDIFFNSTDNLTESLATPALIQGRDKLRQDVTKFLQTLYGDNKIHPLYGIGYQDFIGTKLTPGLDTLIQIRTTTGLDYLRSLYVQQKKEQPVSPSEQFQRLGSVNVDFDPSSPVAMLITAMIYSFDNQSVNVEYMIPLIPQPSIALVSSNVASFELLG